MSDTQPILRQWMLLRMLASRRYGVGVRELAEEFNVCQRTIRRDLLSLRRVGLPLTETKVEHGKHLWKIADSGALPPITFSLTEILSLYLGRRFLEPLAGTYFWDGAQSAFSKIRASLDEQAIGYLEKVADVLHGTNLGASDYSKRGELIDALMVGIEDRRFTDISYQSMRSTEPVSTTVHPYGLIFHRGSLYLVAYAPDHEELRHYKVDRIDDAEVTDLRFTKPADFNLQTHLAHTFGIYHGTGEPMRVRIRFLPAVVRYVRESQWHPSQKLITQRDGSLLAEFELSQTEEIKSWILSFGSKAIVLGPARLRDEVLAELQASLTNYPRTSHDERSRTNLSRNSK